MTIFKNEINEKQKQHTLYGFIDTYLCGVDGKNIDVVDLDTAKHLKLCGFDKPTHWYWLDKDLQFVHKGLKRVHMGKRRMNHNKYDEFIYSAPTREETKRWIKKNIL